jgi:hypothetical protein
MDPAAWLSEETGTFACELAVGVETASVDEIALRLFPSQSSEFSPPALKLTTVLEIWPFLHSLPVKLVEVEPSSIIDEAILEVSASRFSRVVDHFSLVVGSICENADAQALGFTFLKMARINGPVLLEEFPPPRRQTVLREPTVTSSSSP